MYGPGKKSRKYILHHPPYVPYSREWNQHWPFTPSIGILGKYLPRVFAINHRSFTVSPWSEKKPIKNRFRAPLSPLRALSHRYLLDHLPQAPPVEEASCLQQQTQPKAQRKKPQSWGLVTQGGYCKMAWISLTCMGKKLIKHSCDFRFKLF